MDKIEYIGKEMSDFRHDDSKIRIGNYSQENLNTDHEAYEAMVFICMIRAMPFGICQG